MLVYPPDFEDQNSHEDNDPSGLREFFCKSLQEVAASVPLTVKGKPVTDTSATLSFEGDIDAEAFIERCITQLTRMELVILLEMARIYRDQVEQEIGRSDPGMLETDAKKIAQDPFSMVTLARSRVSAGLLQQIFEEALIEAIENEDTDGRPSS